MKKYIYTMLLVLARLAGMAQTNEPLPSGAQPLTNQLYLSPSDSTVWAADPFSGLAIKVGTWFKVDSLFKLGYTKAQVDSLLASKADTSASLLLSAMKHDYTVLAKSQSPPLTSISIGPYASDRINIYYNYANSTTVEYSLLKNPDGLFVVDGAYFGSTLSGEVDPSDSINVIQPGVRVEFAINAREAGTSDPYRWVPYHPAFTGTTRNITVEAYVDGVLTALESIASRMDDVNEVKIIQKYEGFYPTGVTSFWDGGVYHTFNSDQMTIGVDIIPTRTFEIASSYLALVEGSGAETLTVGDSTYTYPVPGVGNINISKPSGNIMFSRTWGGGNVTLSGKYDLLSAIDWPRRQYIDGAMFLGASNQRKVYWNIAPRSPDNRTVSVGDNFRIVNKIFVGQ